MLRRGVRLLKHSQCLCISSSLKFRTSVFPLLNARFDKDLPNPKVLTPVSKLYDHDKDILLGQVKNCKTLDKLLELISMHIDVMNTTHVVACLENIHSFVKDDKVLANNLIENPVFRSLSSRLMKVIRLFEPDEVITCYKLFCTLQVRNNTYIMQCILKMLGAQMNNMSLGQLTFLSFLLHKQRHNPLVDGLRLALPLVLQVQIDQQLDSDNLRDVVNCLQLACRARLKPSVIQKIVNVVSEKVSSLSTEEALTVVFSLLNIETPIDGYKELLESSLDILSTNVSEMSERKILTVLKTIHNQRVYHYKLFYNIANLIVSDCWNLETTYWALHHFYNMEFAPPNIIDHFTNVLCSESYQYHENASLNPLSCVEYMTGTSYHPTNCDEAARILYSNESKLENLKVKFPNLFVKFLSCLAMIGHFPSNLLSDVLDENFLFNTWHISKRLGRASEFERYLLCLYWAIKVHGEENNFVLPSSVMSKVICSVFQKHSNDEYPLEKFIENGLGGSQFLQTGVLTEDGQVIDHVVAMRSGNYPVSLQNMKSKERKDFYLRNLKFVEDIILPEDAKIIAVIVGKEEHYFKDPEILKGWVDLKVKSLAKKDYATVVINYSVWKDLPDREKIPFLMREIKQVVPDTIAYRSDFS